jgi:hypothetical protein
MIWTIFTWVLPAWNLLAAGLLLRYVAYRSAETREREAAMWGSTRVASPVGRLVAWCLVATSAATLVAMLASHDPVIATLPWAQFIANAIADRTLGRDGTKRRARRATQA